VRRAAVNECRRGSADSVGEKERANGLIGATSRLGNSVKYGRKPRQRQKGPRSAGHFQEANKAFRGHKDWGSAVSRGP
jgi:hypothetical protein